MRVKPSEIAYNIIRGIRANTYPILIDEIYTYMSYVVYIYIL